MSRSPPPFDAALGFPRFVIVAVNHAVSRSPVRERRGAASTVGSLTPIGDFPDVAPIDTQLELGTDQTQPPAAAAT